MTAARKGLARSKCLLRRRSQLVAVGGQLGSARMAKGTLINSGKWSTRLGGSSAVIIGMPSRRTLLAGASASGIAGLLRGGPTAAILSGAAETNDVSTGPVDPHAALRAATEIALKEDIARGRAPQDGRKLAICPICSFQITVTAQVVGTPPWIRDCPQSRERQSNDT